MIRYTPKAQVCELHQDDGNGDVPEDVIYFEAYDNGIAIEGGSFVRTENVNELIRCIRKAVDASRQIAKDGNDA